MESNSNITRTSPPLPEEYDDRAKPLGWEFNPTHETNVIVLRKKIGGIPINLDQTIDVDGGFYSKTPDEIFASRPYKKKYLAMALRSFKKKGQKRFNRQVTGAGDLVLGSWDGKGKVSAVLDSSTGATIGTRSRYRFYSGCSKTAHSPSPWKMDEYLSISPSMLSLCCVYQSESKEEKAARKSQKKLDKSVRVAQVRAATARLRAEKTAALAKEAEDAMLKENTCLDERRLLRAQGLSGGGEGASGAAAAASSSISAAAAAAASSSNSVAAALIRMSSVTAPAAWDNVDDEQHELHASAGSVWVHGSSMIESVEVNEESPATETVEV